MALIRSNCCNAPIQEKISPAVVIYDVEITDTGLINHSMLPLVDGEICGYRCSACGNCFEDADGNIISDVKKLIEYLQETT